jgi:hypothetical protein
MVELILEAIQHKLPQEAVAHRLLVVMVHLDRPERGAMVQHQRCLAYQILTPEVVAAGLLLME